MWADLMWFVAYALLPIFVIVTAAAAALLWGIALIRYVRAMIDQ